MGVPAHDIPAEDWQARALAAEDDLDQVNEHLVRRAEALELELERYKAHLPGFMKFCNDLACTSINPIARRARVQANTLQLLLPPSENDDEGWES